MRRAALLILLSAFCLSAEAEGLAGSRLVSELRRGGYILYLRHTATDFSKNDQGMTSFEDCTTQRNLTDAGREQARRIGEQLRRLQIPVGRVLASPFCRTVESALLAFGRTEKTPEVRGGPARPDDPKRYEPLRNLLSNEVKTGENLVISSHGNPFFALFGPPYLAEGEIAVIRPAGKARFEIVARMHLADWDALAP